MPLEKIARWSGPAAVIGGALWAVLWLRGGEDFSLLWFFAAAIPFMAIALAGLYRHLPAGGGRALVFGVTLVGLVLLLASALGLAFASGDWGWTLLLSGFSVMILGIGSMGAIAIRERALGLWSFLPLVLAAFHLGSLVTIDDAGPDTVHLTFDVLGGFCWLLLGLVLWTRREDTSGPTQFA